ncbi:hypothetical protein CAEBREN_28836, partial [Caenorhabditis brenneri]
GVADCANGSDEENCPRRKLCDATEFRCGNGLCIKQNFVCDGKMQCLDGLDEEHCEEEDCIKGREFRCKNGNSACMDLIFRCDGVPDCEDESDESEEFCKGNSSSTCAKMNQFMCADGKCLRSFQLCDGFPDCLTGEDEKDCPASMCNSTTHFSCSSGNKCVSKQLECDGVDDCGDNSDEAHCKTVRTNCFSDSNKQTIHFQASELRCLSDDSDGTTPSSSLFKCHGNKVKCISDKLLCDGKKDCDEGDDEGLWCSIKCDPSDLGCSHTCRNTPFGPICSCPDDHYLAKDHATCTKKSPCRFGQCSQHCIPHGSTHFCYCEDGFKLSSDKFSCYSDDPQKPFLIYSNRHEIRMIQSKYPGSSPMISNLVNAIALDFKYHQNGSVSIYWTDLSSDKIYSGLVEQRTISYQRTIVSYGVFNAEGICRPIWITGKYSTGIDSYLGKLISSGVSEKRKKRKQTIGAVTADGERGRIYFADYDKFRISAVNFDGSGCVVIAEDVGVVPSMTYDEVNRELYFIRANPASIWRIDVADNNLETYPTEPRIVLTLTIRDRPRHIAIHPCRSLLFFTNNAITGSVIEQVYFSGFKRTQIVQEDLHDLRGLTIDLDSEKLYFSDSKDFKLSRCDFDGTNRELVVSNSDIPSIHPFELAVYENEIIFTDWVRRSVVAINKITGTDNRTLNRAIEVPNSIVYFLNSCVSGTENACFNNDLKCEDYCRLMADGQPTCACNGERRLNSDNRTCTGERNEKKCAENEFKCLHSDRCIRYEDTCDQFNDCPMFDDEDAKYCSTRVCRPGYFTCGNGLCIPESKVCNRVNDCTNFADEANCTCSAMNSDVLLEHVFP